ncbi:hypothetical protein F5Y00DRAFT_239829, partial [Daldinia vernicosa]|uniref:uncharacterized protein n=1 Tax=Daldinia vernicosa TaxID=114800 RepID=UPI002007A7A4
MVMTGLLVSWIFCHNEIVASTNLAYGIFSMLNGRREMELFVDQVKSSGKVDGTNIHRHKKSIERVQQETFL